ncbi:alpha/beta fold hydrolase [Nocardia terpenica]|uniref:Alpha/beta fold hydrolase n=1 Tax=Nocardia terpenica TaxID=455432 RepID=A0A6G9ZC91_9NOCA|nr:alpha/beta hydrolase [Nocardia terpenica]QIS23011.1 alpha/beta fold hydrolase [Nocardia terpenica]
MSPTPVRPTLARTVLGSGPAVLLAHGAGGGVRANYGPVLDALAERHTVIGADYPGTGESAPALAPLELDALADELVAAAAAEGHERFAVVGYSLGTSVAVRIATRYPDRVTALILTAPFARPDNRMLLLLQLWRELYRSGRHDLLARFMQTVAWSAERLESFAPHELSAMLQEAEHTFPTGTADQADLGGRVDTRAELARIQVPALVVVTTADLLVPPSVQYEVATDIPTARTAELPTGHLPFAEQPDEWATLMTKFLADVE